MNSNPDIWTVISAIGAIGSAIAATVGLGFVVWQLNATRRIASADLILRLEAEWVDHFAGTYMQFLPGARLAPGEHSNLSVEDRVSVENYLDFFSTLNTLSNHNLLRIEIIDEMFAYRFFVVVNNPHAQVIISSNKVFWRGLSGLHEKWVKYRIKRGLPVINHEISVDA